MSQDTSFPYTRTQDYAATPKLAPGFTPSTRLAVFNIDDVDRGGNQNDTVIVDNKQFSPASHQFAEGDFISPGFFSRAHLDGFTRRFRYSQWTYEMRREPQHILPFLSLGPSSFLRDHEALRTQGFTLLLGIRNTRSALARLVSGGKSANLLGIQHDTIDVRDNQELISAFPRAIRRINDHLSGDDVPNNGATQLNDNMVTDSATSQPINRKVLVFCETGNERSAATVVAYVMAMLNQNSTEATCMIQQHRFCATIEEETKHILQAFDSILAAKRDVEIARRNAVQPASLSSLAPPPIPPILLANKRRFGDLQDDEEIDMDDGDVDMDEDGDMLLERKPMAPFQDRVV